MDIKNSNNNSNIPSPEDIRKEMSEFLKSRYGDRVVIPPQPDKGSGETDGTDQKKPPTEINFDLRPTELEKYLKKYVIGQDEAVEILSTKICTHFNRMKLENSKDFNNELVGNIKSNMLMIGPTGVGKTYLIKLIAQKLGVPFVKGDATKYSETGYVGGDVEDLVRALVHEANGDIKLAEYGIIYLDEIDKIASSGSSVGPDVSRSGVQRNLLKLMEESEVDLKTPHDLASQMEAAMEAQRTGKVKRKKINTRNILFVMSGAFSGLSDIIQRRLNKQPMGFRSDEDLKDIQIDDELEILKRTRSEDLIKFGFESEFVGRLPVTMTLNNLDIEGLYRILKSANSTVVLGKKRDFQAYGIKLEFTDDALYEIARRAHDEQTGARGLVSVVDRLMLKFEKYLPDTDIKEYTVTKHSLDHSEELINDILTNYYIKKFQKRFLASNGIVITFTPEAIKIINEKSNYEDKTFEEYCSDMLRDYEYGLRLLKAEEFTVDEEIVLNPKVRLEELIKKAYHDN
jgi:endopeptidase Clp ATP-binding regulatory subunit ClpX